MDLLATMEKHLASLHKDLQHFRRCILDESKIILESQGSNNACKYADFCDRINSDYEEYINILRNLISDERS